MQPQDFQERLAGMDEGKRQQMVQMLKLLASPPETLLALFERVGLTWEKRQLAEYPSGAMVIDWNVFLSAEATNQTQGPIMKRLLTEEYGDQATQKEIGSVVRDLRPQPFGDNPNG